MATAQDLFTNWFAGNIPTGGRITAVNSYATGIIEVVGNSAAAFQCYLSMGRVGLTPGVDNGTSVAGGVKPWVTYKAGNPYTVYLIFPTTLAPNDQIRFHVDAADYQYHLDPVQVVDVGGIKYSGDFINHDIPGAQLAPGEGETLDNPPTNPAPQPPTNQPPAAGTTGSPILPATRALAAGVRALVVYEQDPVSGGRMRALDPANASGIPIPAFRPVASIPTAGSLIGQAVINTTNGLSYVWDGIAWKPIVPPSVVTYVDDNAVFADNAAQAGTYAFSASSGNLFVRFTDAGGNDVWRQIGVRTYGTQANLLADAAADGSIGYAVDTQIIWHRVGGAWKASSFITDTETNIMAMPSTAGMVAVTTDTGRVWLGNGTDWVGAYVHEYQTQAALQAATPLDGELAVVLDDGYVYYRTNGNWLPLNEATIPTGTTDPLNPKLGDLFYNTTTNSVKVYDGAVWVAFSVNNFGDLGDVDLATTPAKAGDSIGYDGHKWVPTPDPTVRMGAEPALAQRYHGMLWWGYGRLWIWDTANVWVEV